MTSDTGGDSGTSLKNKGKEKEGNELEETPQEMDDVIIPEEGMAFYSLDEAHVFYNKYARDTGFGTKVRTTYREQEEVIKCTITCTREGKCSRGNNSINSRKKSSRIGCPAKINVRRHTDGLWYLMKVNLEHNHLVSPSETRFCRRNKKLNERVKKQLELNDKAGIPICKPYLALPARAGGIGNLSFGEKDTRNFIERTRRLRLGEGDAEAIHQFFMRMQKQNSNFFHLMDIDGDGLLRHVFWADARSRASYKYFNDVISFDTTYLTNKYDMPFVTFVGVNHHGQSVLLGCGLLSSESIESYVWLFTAWLSCMSGRPPSAIITDQFKSIQGAISIVFPKARHRLCLWHIMKRVPEKLGGYKEHEAIVRKLEKTVYDTLRVEEFEQSWAEMIEDFSLQDNEWLQSLYDVRHKWVPVFVKDTFWAGMSTTQRSESMNAFFDSYVNSKTSLKQFISQYDIALERKYENEALADFTSFHKERELISNMPMEKQLRTLYTSNMFIKFQEEVRNVLNCRYTITYENGPLSIYEVQERMNIDGISEPISKLFEVYFNAEKLEVQCICRSFEFQGILCKHAICVLNHKDVSNLPSQYIIERWRKDFKRLHGLKVSAGEAFECAPIDRYDDIYMHCHQIAKVGSMSDFKYKCALNGIKNLMAELIACGEENQDNIPIGIVGIGEPETPWGIDHVLVKRKGRPRELRLQSTIEKKVTAKKNKKKSISGHENNIQGFCLQSTVGKQVIATKNKIGSNPNSNSISSDVNTNPWVPYTDTSQCTTIPGTQESINMGASQTEPSSLFGGEFRVHPCLDHTPYSFVPMANSPKPHDPRAGAPILDLYKRNIDTDDEHRLQ